MENEKLLRGICLTVQSIVKTPSDALKKVTTLVVGQLKGKVNVVGTGQLVAIVISGVLNGINDCGGQSIVSGLTVDGIVSVVTVAAVAAMVVVNWVWKVVLNEGTLPPLAIDVQGFVTVPS